jgi:hypothetical protein
MYKRVKVSGNYIEIRLYQHPPKNKDNISKALATKRLRKEIKQFNNFDEPPIEVKEKRSNNLQRVRSKLNDLVYANASSYTKFITLTTQENIQDLSVFQKHLHHWFKGVQRQLNEPLRYVGVYEYQERGALHLHLFVFNQKPINWKKSHDSWTNIIKGKGTVQIKAIPEIHLTRQIRYCLSYISNSTLTMFGRKSLLVSTGLLQPIKYDYLPTTLPYNSVSLSYGRYITNQYHDIEVYSGVMTNKEDNGITIASFDELINYPGSVMSRRLSYWYKHKKFPK